ncbi:MAG: tyrosine-type recombinase/integrase, partial [Deltaproteobacteria bacterium]
MARVFRRDGAYWIDYLDEDGKRHRKNTGATVKRVAQEILDQVRTEVARREHFGFTDGKTSFPTHARAWIAGRLGKVASTTHVAYSTAIERHLVPAFPGSLRSITTESVDQFRSERLAAGLAPSTINVIVTVLSAILKTAVREKKLSRHPLAGFERLRTNNERTRYLSPDEIARILAACDAIATTSRVPGAYLRAFITLALNLGARRNEILSLTRRTADLGARVAIFGKTKGGRPRIVPLNAAAIEAIRLLPLPVHSDSPLFPFKPLDMTRGFSVVAA